MTLNVLLLDHKLQRISNEAFATLLALMCQHYTWTDWGKHTASQKR